MHRSRSLSEPAASGENPDARGLAPGTRPGPDERYWIEPDPARRNRCDPRNPRRGHARGSASAAHGARAAAPARPWGVRCHRGRRDSRAGGRGDPPSPAHGAARDLISDRGAPARTDLRRRPVRPAPPVRRLAVSAGERHGKATPGNIIRDRRRRSRREGCTTHEYGRITAGHRRRTGRGVPRPTRDERCTAAGALLRCARTHG